MANTIELPLTIEKLVHYNNGVATEYENIYEGSWDVLSEDLKYVSLKIDKSSIPTHSSTQITLSVTQAYFEAANYAHLQCIFLITDKPLSEEELLGYSNNSTIPKNYGYYMYDRKDSNASGGYTSCTFDIILDNDILSKENLYITITRKDEYSGVRDVSFIGWNFKTKFELSYLGYEVSFDENVQLSGTVSNLPDSMTTDISGSITIPDITPSHTNTESVKEIIITGKGNGGIDISSSGTIITNHSYTHKGWSFGGILYVAGDKLYTTSDCTLSASWEQSVVDEVKDLPSIGTTTREDFIGSSKIILDANGGTCATKEITGNYITSYELKEWNTVAAGIGFSYPVGTTFEDSTTLYAIWTPRTVYNSVTLPTAKKLDNGLFEYSHVGWSLGADSISAEFKDTLSLESIEDLSTLYAIYNIPEINYSLYLGTQKLENVYLGTKEIKFCIPEQDRLRTLGYSPNYYYIIPREEVLKDSTVDLLYMNPDIDNTSWVISETEPTNPVEGMVWIETIKLNSGDFTFEGDPIYLVRGMQYIAGKWVYNDTTKFREKGIWQEFGYDEYHLIIYTGSNSSMNIIRLGTNVPVNGYVISEEEPVGVEEGTIWIIPYSTSLSINPPVIINDETTYPKKCKQYTNAGWIEVLTETYDEGEYTIWGGGTLYDSKDIQELTGGWVCKGSATNSGKTLSVYSECIEGYSSGISYVRTRNKIYIAKGRLIVSVASLTNRSSIGWDRPIQALISKNEDLSSPVASVSSSGGGAQSLEIDLSRVDIGDYYVGIYAHVANGGSDAVSATISGVKIVY